MSDSESWPRRPSDCEVCRSLVGPEPAAIDYPPVTRLADRRMADRIRGALIAGALGDGVGQLAEQGRRLDWDLIEPARLVTGGATQLTLFTAEGCLRMLVRADIKGIGPGFLTMRHAYDRWLLCQQRLPQSVRERWEQFTGNGWPDGWLVRRHELHSRRPGFDGTAHALRTVEHIELEAGELHPRVNHSNGAGAVVRSAAVGLLIRPDMAFEYAVRNAGYTHGGADAYLGSGFVAALVAHMVAGSSFAKAALAGRAELARWPHHSQLLAVVDAALGGGALPDGASHGSGAVYWALRGRMEMSKLEDLMAWTSIRGGTSATTVAGSLWGAENGASRIAGPARVAVDLAAIIEEMSDALVLGQRAWNLGHALGPEPEGMFDGSGTAQLLWDRFRGW